MRRFLTGILIRNNRLKIHADRGMSAKFEILSDAEYANELKRKLVEEANEVGTVQTRDELKTELADVWEVIEHIMDVHKISMDELLAAKAAKQIRVGKFDQKIKEIYVDIPEDKAEALEYYLSQPHKYPEVSD